MALSWNLVTTNSHPHYHHSCPRHTCDHLIWLLHSQLGGATSAASFDSFVASSKTADAVLSLQYEQASR